MPGILLSHGNSLRKIFYASKKIKKSHGVAIPFIQDSELVSTCRGIDILTRTLGFPNRCLKHTSNVYLIDYIKSKQNGIFIVLVYEIFLNGSCMICYIFI